MRIHFNDMHVGEGVYATSTSVHIVSAGAEFKQMYRAYHDGTRSGHVTADGKAVGVGRITAINASGEALIALNAPAQANLTVTTVEQSAPVAQKKKASSSKKRVSKPKQA